MMLGEFTSMSAIHSILSDFTPRPIGWGTYASNPDCHFFLATFHDMADELPDINGFASKVAELHMKSKSPNDKFGFPVTTFSGNAPQDNSWTDTWEEFFTQAVNHMLRLEEEAQGPSEEMRSLGKALVDKVIPRLLRPMEIDGRKVTPCLVHGDLWYGNACRDLRTNTPIIFDACSFYAHNECKSLLTPSTYKRPRRGMIRWPNIPVPLCPYYQLIHRPDELGTWRSPHYKIGKPYVRAYHKKYPISEPIEDHDDRNALYSM